MKPCRTGTALKLPAGCAFCEEIREETAERRVLTRTEPFLFWVRRSRIKKTAPPELASAGRSGGIDRLTGGKDVPGGARERLFCLKIVPENVPEVPETEKI